LTRNVVQLDQHKTPGDPGKEQPCNALETSSVEQCKGIED
jgi:hypothetical protein